MNNQYVLRGGSVYDAGTGQSTRADIGIANGVVVPESAVTDAEVVDVSGLTVMFGLWDCHAHPGGLMYDPPATGYFEGPPSRTIRAGINFAQAVEMGVTGVRAVGEASDIDIAWSHAYRSGAVAGPRVVAAGRSIGTTGGHGTAYPRKYTDVEPRIVADGETEMRRAVRFLVEHGATWIKVAITGGLYSEHETVDGRQFTLAELEAVVEAAGDRGVSVAAHCGSARQAEEFARLGGRSVEHGYALDDAAAATMAECGTWLVPTISVTHDRQMMVDTGWPEHAVERAWETASGHAQALKSCLAAGVKIATGADLNPIGPRLHRELELLAGAGMSTKDVLYAATTSSRSLMGLGEQTAPSPGAEADLIFIEGDPVGDLSLLRRPKGVMTFGRFVVHPR